MMEIYELEDLQELANKGKIKLNILEEKETDIK